MVNFENKKVLIMGLGLHGGGVAVAKWFVKRGAIVTITDLKTRKELKNSLIALKGLHIKYVLGRHEVKDFETNDYIIQNPGVPKESHFLMVAKDSGAEIYNEAGLFFEFSNKENIIGITGTRGKSTTTMLTYEILKQKFPKTLYGGNIRTQAMFDIIEKAKNNLVVLELSSWQLEGLEAIKQSPHIAVFTNLMPDHLNRYKDINDYIEAKEAIFRYQSKKDYSIFNKDNKITNRVGKTTPSQRYWISLKSFANENGCFVKGGKIIFRQNNKETEVMKVSDIAMPGEHNVYNVLCAITVGIILKVGVVNIRSAVINFKGLEDRLELVKEIKGVKYYNDTTSTTPDAGIAALKSLGKKKNIVLIAGGNDKKLEYSEFAREVKKSVKMAILLGGDATAKMKSEFELVGFKNFSEEFYSMDEAVKEAKKHANDGDIILLSPSATSFGIFVNEFDRGEQFKKSI